MMTHLKNNNNSGTQMKREGRKVIFNNNKYKIKKIDKILRTTMFLRF